MIHFEDLDLICRIDNHFYKLVIDGQEPLADCCERCALDMIKTCSMVTCSAVKYKMHFHYEEISKETCDAMRLFAHKR